MENHMLASHVSMVNRFFWGGVPHVKLEGNANRERMLFVGKVENQDSFLLFNGTSLLLTRPVRRINTDWQTHMTSLEVELALMALDGRLWKQSRSNKETSSRTSWSILCASLQKCGTFNFGG